MLPPVLAKNDNKAKWLILVVSFVVFAAVVLLSRIKLEVDLGFNVHVFAKLNAFVNSIVSLLLLAGLMVVRQGKYEQHKKIMIAALILSVIFLVSYICHHLFAGETKFGDIDHDGVVTEAEKALVGGKRTFYYIILATHIPLAAIILPFILFTAYRALISEWPLHKKLARITWPIWLYVSVTGVLVYLLISPYY
jgi:putative membrane protein